MSFFSFIYENLCLPASRPGSKMMNERDSSWLLSRALRESMIIDGWWCMSSGIVWKHVKMWFKVQSGTWWIVRDLQENYPEIPCDFFNGQYLFSLDCDAL